MPFLRQAQGLRLNPHPLLLPSNGTLYPSTVRCASHWNRNKKHQLARASQAKPHSDHYETEFGKRQKQFWKSITPDFLTQEMETRLGRISHFAHASSFKLRASHKSASKPVVEASSTSRDSKTNEIKHSVYDPISGRMVPTSSDQTRHTFASAKSGNDTQPPIKSYQKPAILSQSPDQSRLLTNTPTSQASFTEDFDKIYESEHEELLAARRHLDTLREQVQILERQAHPELTKPQDAIDSERPAVFEDGWDSQPKGLQTAFEHEKEACEHGEMKPLEQEMAALNKEPVQEINDDYSIAPSGMETLFAHEQEINDIGRKSTLEQELVAMNAKATPHDDGYSITPKGLETLFEQEQQKAEHGERESLEDEVKKTGSVDNQPPYSDVYAKEPIGLETMYDREQKRTPQRLEHELESQASEPAVRDPDDAYSTEPIGMQTLYEREESESQRGQRQDLEQELHDHLQTRSSNHGFLPELEGMQTLWQREQEQVERGNVLSLEEEIQAQQQPTIAADEFDTVPFGMETHFNNEIQDVDSSKSETLEEEVSRKIQTQAYDDGYSRSPIGLQTAFVKEEKDAMLGKRQTLEKEINTREPAFEDGYSTMPMGLQMMFRREKQDDGRSLEEDIKRMEEASYHEDGYSRAPIGMENSFDREIKAEADSLETDLKDIPGEGDLSPTVGKFATSNKWYKQPARSTFSEDSQKADNETLSRQNAIFGSALGENISTPIEPGHSLPKTVTTAENDSPANTSESSFTDASLSSGSEVSATWAEPPLYKLITYDSSKDAITITTTPSNFSNAESPISIPYAISHLNQAARFIPHLASLQNEGFQAIHVEKDYLILRKVRTDSISRSSRLGGSINPVDGTTKHLPIEPPSARFASPTGFVNYEPVFPSEPVSRYNDTMGTCSDITTHGHPEFEQQVYHQDSTTHSRRRKHRDGGARREKRGRWRRRAAWVMSVAAGTAACTYVVGVADELARPEKHVMRVPK